MIRHPTLHISCVQHDGTIILEDELAHHLWDFLGKDLKTEEIHQLVSLKIFDQLLEECGIDPIQVGPWTLTIFVGLKFTAAVQLKDVALDLCGIEIGEAGGLGPASANGLQGTPKHDFVFIQLEVSMDEMYSEFVLDIEPPEQTSQLLEMNLLYFRLVFVVREKIVPVQGELVHEPSHHLAQTYASDDCFRSSLVGGT